MATTFCLDCADCLVVNFNCLVSGNTPIHQRMSKLKVLAAARQAQDVWLRDTLQEDCFTALCDALKADAEGTTALSADYLTLMQRYIIPLLNAATTYEYICVHGTDELYPNQEVDAEEKAKLNRTNAIVFQRRLKKYLEANTDKFPCYVAEDLGPCEVENELPDGMDYDVVSRYPTTGYHPYELDPDFKHKSDYNGRSS